MINEREKQLVKFLKENIQKRKENNSHHKKIQGQKNMGMDQFQKDKENHKSL